jgi:hypothetical protein
MHSLNAQEGDYITVDHIHNLPNIDHSTFDMLIDQNGLLCIANRSGVLDYDGSDWTFYKTPSAALSMDVDSTNTIYVSCINSIGYINRRHPQNAYQEILSLDTLDDLFLDAYFLGQSMIFVGSEHIILHDTKTRANQILYGAFANSFVLDNQLFVNTVDGQTQKVTDTLEDAGMKYIISFSSSTYNGQQLLIDYEGELFRYASQSIERLPHGALAKSYGIDLQEAQWVNDTLFAGSTFEKGVAFFNINDTTYIAFSDYQSGLPDNEIFTITSDQSGSIWAAHTFGLSLIWPSFPALSYSGYSGLRGNLTSSHTINNELWVTSSVGIFYFDNDTLYENKVYYEKVPLKKSQKRAPRKPQKKEESPQAKEPGKSLTTGQKKKKLSIKRIFQKKERAVSEDKKELSKDKSSEKNIFRSISKGFTDLFDNEDNVSSVKGGLDKNYRYVKRSKKIPVGVSYEYKSVPNANGKFIDLIEFNGILLGVSNSGIYEVTKEDSRQIIADNIRKAIVTEDQKLVVSTANLEIKLFELIRDVWVEKFSESMDDIIVNLKSYDSGQLLLAGSSRVFKADYTDSSFQISRNYPIQNKYLDRLEIITIADTTYFVNRQGYFYYDQVGDTITRNTYFEKMAGLPVNYLLDDSKGDLWVYDGKKWNRIDTGGQISSFEYMSIFPGLRSLSTDQQTGNLWFLTNNDYILRYDPSIKQELFSRYPLFVKRTSSVFGKDQPLELTYDENYLSVEVSKPDFKGLLNTEFQYRLVGLNDSWSSWSKSKTIDFSYLPAGNYNLQVRTRDAFGRESQSEVLSFRVKAPYWQTPWFYALEILFFGSLVVLSSRMNQSNSTNRFLSGALTALTLVIIIEFLQSAIGSLFSFKSTPVIDFAIDASIALMIFPLESFLRTFITKGKVNLPLGEKLSTEKVKSKNP